MQKVLYFFGGILVAFAFSPVYAQIASSSDVPINTKEIQKTSIENKLTNATPESIFIFGKLLYEIQNACNH